ncbi:MAG: hypothetical protein COZ57_27370, partial [Armatimonadetes bacterium CG_4_8_14_3_um_filter_66_20]
MWVRRGGAALALAGVDDVWEQAADLEQALRGVPADACTVLLAHEPDFADQARRRPVDLQLSGHSHGGQVWLPLLGAPVLPRYGHRYPCGWYRLDHLQLNTNRGVGCITPPIRLNCPPAIALFELRSAQL